MIEANLENVALRYTLAFIAGLFRVDEFLLQKEVVSRGIRFSHARGEAVDHYLQVNRDELTNAEMAYELELDPDTIRKYLRRIKVENSETGGST